MASDYVMRWMVARDMPQIVGIERSLEQVPAWEETALRDLLREANVIGIPTALGAIASCGSERR